MVDKINGLFDKLMVDYKNLMKEELFNSYTDETINDLIAYVLYEDYSFECEFDCISDEFCSKDKQARWSLFEEYDIDDFLVEIVKEIGGVRI